MSTVKIGDCKFLIGSQECRDVLLIEILDRLQEINSQLKKVRPG